ncbi:MAG: enoyl-CoA hydratase-related protein [Alphaproteobacteria bacterium]
MAQYVRTERHGGVLEVVLDRPPVNAINLEVSNQLYDAFATLKDDPALRVGIVTGVGERVFSAGWDLKAVAASSSPTAADDSALHKPGGFAGLTEFWDLHKPVIAAVNGVAIGGGFELALAADIMVVADHVEFWLPEMQRGFLADAGAVQRLPKRIPYNVAMELLLTGRHMGAAEAVHWGLVYKAVPRAKLMEEAHALAALIAEGAPLATEALLTVMPMVMDMSEKDSMALLKRGKSGVPIYEKMANSEDFLEGPRAFAEKRKPVWKGR